MIYHIRAAEGWLELDMPAEALAEMESLPLSRRREPVVFMMLWRIHSEMGDWERAADVSAKLVQVAPDEEFGWIHRSYALHELRQTAEAAALLRPAVDMFPDQELIPYNLACYACQLGRIDECKAWLDLALQRGSRSEIKERALTDPDLLPVRDYILALAG